MTWSPDGRTIAATINFYPADANPLLWAGGKVPTPSSEILSIDVESGITTSFYKEEKAMLYATPWSPDSKKIVVVYGESFLEDKDKIGIWIFDVAKDFQPEHIGKGEDAAWNPNGDTLAIISRLDVNNAIWNMRLYNLDTKTVMDPKNWTLPLGVELRTRKEVQNAEETQEF